MEPAEVKALLAAAVADTADWLELEAGVEPGARLGAGCAAVGSEADVAAAGVDVAAEADVAAAGVDGAAEADVAAAGVDGAAGADVAAPAVDVAAGAEAAGVAVLADAESELFHPAESCVSAGALVGSDDFARSGSCGASTSGGFLAFAFLELLDFDFF